MERIAKGIYRIRIGRPEQLTPVYFKETSIMEAEIEQVPISKKAGIQQDDIQVAIGSQGVHINLPIQGTEDIYGFGLQLFSVNQAGLRRLIKVNSDPPCDTGENHAPVPFYISTAGYGLFVDTYRYTEFYMGTNTAKGSSSHMTSENEKHEEFSEEALYSLRKFKEERKVVIDVPAVQGVDIYLFEGNVREVVQRYNLFSGGGCVPPMWGLGIWYRTYGGSSQEDVIKMADAFQNDQMPIEVLGLEPGWQSHTYSCSYKWSNLFPNPEKMITELQKKGIKINLWEHAFVYPTAPFYNEIMPYCGDVEVWNGLVPDFALPEAREIFEDYHYHEFVEKGVAGFKLDECDNSDYNQSNWSYRSSAQFPSGMDGEQMHSGIGVFYQSVINAVYKRAGKRTYSQIRSSGALASSYPFVLYSDLYDHKQFVKGMSTSGFSGLLWCPEVRDCVDGKDLLRRIETVMFSAHALINSWRIPNPPWKQVDIEKNLAGEEMIDARYYTEVCRNFMNLRMQLLPYLYSAFQEYHLYGIPPVRSMVLEFPDDEQVRRIEDQYYFGKSLIVCPLIREDGVEREVYLPEGTWFHFFTKERYEGGKTFPISADYSEIPIFVRDGAIVPLAQPVAAIKDDTVFDMEIHVFGQNAGTFRLYQDDATELNESQEWSYIECSRERGENLKYKTRGKACSRYRISGVHYWQ